MARQTQTTTFGMTLAIAVSGLLGGVASATDRPAVVQAAATVSGQVVTASGAPLAGADVSEQPQGRRTRTDAAGRFHLAGLQPGRHVVRVQHPGHAPVERTVEVAANSVVSLRIAMQALAPAAPPTQDPAKADAPKPAEVRESAAVAIPVKSRRPATTTVYLGAGRAGVSHGYGSASGGGGIGYGGGGMGRVAVMAGPSQVTEVENSREGYDAIDEQSFQSVTDKPLSTLSIDVDTAAYSNVRRIVDSGRMPPKDAVRIEELINYFPYEYKGPQGDAPFAVHTEVSIAPWNPAHRLARIGIQGRRIEARDLPPCHLTFLIDVSGSMNSHDKLPLLQRSLALLVQELRPQDKVALVVYAGAAGLVLPPTSGEDKATILQAIAQLQAGGSTAGGEGIALAYDVATRNFLKGASNRVILATDGDFNVGASSDGEMVRLIEDRRKSGVFLTVLGFGTGNYQDAKMQKLADAGNGHHAYVDTLLEAQKVLVTEMGATLLTIAQDVKIQVEFNPTYVKGYRLIGYENRLLAARDFNDDKKDAGELGAGHAVTALYEIVPTASGEPLAGADRLKYQHSSLTAGAVQSGELMTVKLRFKAPGVDKSRLTEMPVRDNAVAFAKTSADFRFAASVAAYGLVLRGSPFKGTSTLANVRELASGALGSDVGGYRREFVKLVERTAAVANR